MSEFHDECFGDPDFDSRPESTCNIPVLLEARHDGEWHPVRIAREFPSIRAAMDSLSIFARQQKVHHEDVRVKALRIFAEIVDAEAAIRAYNTRST